MSQYHHVIYRALAVGFTYKSIANSEEVIGRCQLKGVKQVASNLLLTPQLYMLNCDLLFYCKQTVKEEKDACFDGCFEYVDTCIYFYLVIFEMACLVFFAVLFRQM